MTMNITIESIFPAERPVLQADTIHLWIFNRSYLENTLAGRPDLLSAEEKRRSRKLVYPDDRKRFNLYHTATRFMLGYYLAIHGEEVLFVNGPFGKPAIDGSTVRFNVSHSHEYMALAVAQNREIGVDIEYCRPRPAHPGFLQTVAHPDEIEWISRHNAVEQQRLFYELWARKEAFLKATGRGIGRDLAVFPVCVKEGNEAVVEAEGKWWRIRHISGPDRYSCALCYDECSQRLSTATEGND
ncbi:MAG: 4'-phosphopantetheinyl transferase superfamily protein [Chitinispirillaceae bacterium]|nr:4'-phosphopantetheinyl transferase superfamily protein [Chitinispirillaceae bacterium]